MGGNGAGEGIKDTQTKKKQHLKTNDGLLLVKLRLEVNGVERKHTKDD